MSKDYKEISNQVAVKILKNRVLAFYSNLEPVELHNFMELIRGKIKVCIHDYSAGKGDNSVWVSYNLELPDVKYLYERARLSHMPQPYIAQKIYGAYPIDEGRYKGMCKAFHIQIQHVPIRKNNEVSKFPWNILISNGVAESVPGEPEGTYHEKAGTYKELGRAYANLSNADFLDCMEKVNAYMDLFRDLVAQNLIPEGLKALAEVKERNGYRPDRKGSEGQPAKAGPEKSDPKDGKAEPSLKLHPTTLKIQSDFQALASGLYKAKCLINGKLYNIYFDKVPDELKKARSKQMEVTVNLYQDANRRFRCHSIAA